MLNQPSDFGQGPMVWILAVILLVAHTRDHQGGRHCEIGRRSAEVLRWL